jgi:hypothetical protein
MFWQIIRGRTLQRHRGKQDQVHPCADLSGFVRTGLIRSAKDQGQIRKNPQKSAARVGRNLGSFGR